MKKETAGFDLLLLLVGFLFLSMTYGGVEWEWSKYLVGLLAVLGLFCCAIPLWRISWTIENPRAGVWMQILGLVFFAFGIFLMFKNFLLGIAIMTMGAMPTASLQVKRTIDGFVSSKESY